MLRRVVLMTVIALGLSSCDSDTETVKENEKVGDIRQNQVWKNGDKLTGLIRIFEGATVTIEPGARIGCVESVQIQVGGTLRVKSPGKHATIICPRWRGILVASHGEVDLEGIDLENPEVGVETTKDAGNVNVADSSITSSTRPFRVAANTKITATKVNATTPTTLQAFETSVTEVYGTFVAKYLDYQANTNEGIMVMTGGEVDIEDSTLKANNGLDLVSSYGGKSLKIRYSTLNGAHCGPHLQGIGSFEIDHVTSEQNIYGITIYAASVEGPHVIKDSNFQGAGAWLDLQGDHGPLTFTNVFVSGNETVLNTSPPTVTKANARIEDAKPR